MTLQIPSLKDLSARIRGHYDAELEGTQSHIWPNNLYVTAKVIAMMVRELFLRLGFIADQAYVLTAHPDYLDRHGAEYGMTRLPAGRAQGSLAIRNGTPSAEFVEGGRFERNGNIYEVLEYSQLDARGVGSVLIRAIDEGITGNAAPSQPFRSQNVTLGANAEVIADNQGITGGADIESDENYRRRIWFRKRYAPHAGAPSDYVRWAFEVSGFTRVWVRRAFPRPGAVTVVVMMDDTYDDGVPLGGDITRLRDYLYTVAPAGAEIFVVAPRIKTINVTATNVAPLTNEVRAAIEAELAETFRQRADMGTEFSRSWIAQAVSNAVGEDKHILTAPADDTPIEIDELPVLGTVTLT